MLDLPKGLLAVAGTLWLPRAASTVAAEVDSLWGLVFWTCMFFFVLVTFLLFFFVIRFRKRPGYVQSDSPSHNTTLELFWSIIPTILVTIMFWQGFKVYLNITTPPRDSYEIQVMGQKWSWLFTYPNGYIDAELHVPSGRPVRLVMTSRDVIHSFFVPAFRVKRDVVPGRYDEVWFNATTPGVYDIFCAEYCGTSHSTMLSKVHVHEPDEYDAWLEEASELLSRMPPAEAGALLYRQRGCPQCHSVDGTRGSGPTFLGLFGSREALQGGGSVTVDENYVRESLLDPQARVTAGYEPMMPTYRLKDEEVSAIVEYLKTLGGVILPGKEAQ